MGVNAAPPFANLIHRYYEILTPLPSGFGLMHDRLIRKPKPVCCSVHVVCGPFHACLEFCLSIYFMGCNVS